MLTNAFVCNIDLIFLQLIHRSNHQYLIKILWSKATTVLSWYWLTTLLAWNEKGLIVFCDLKNQANVSDASHDRRSWKFLTITNFGPQLKIRGHSDLFLWLQCDVYSRCLTVVIRYSYITKESCHRHLKICDVFSTCNIFLVTVSLDDVKITL